MPKSRGAARVPRLSNFRVERRAATTADRTSARDGTAGSAIFTLIGLIPAVAGGFILRVASAHGAARCADTSPLPASRGSQSRYLSWLAARPADSAAFAGHSLRRSKASELYRRTRDLEACRRLLGHKWITSTQSYIAGASASHEALALAASLDF